MDLFPYAERLRSELTAALDGAPDEVRAAGERLSRSLDATIRLTLFEVLADAAAEITSALPAGSVSARLAGREIEFVVDAPTGVPPQPFPPAGPFVRAEPLTSQHPAPPGAPGAPAPPPPPQVDVQDEGDLARITVRLPEGVKEKAEAQAGQSSQSLNSWIVNTLRQATRPGGVDIDLDLSHLPFFDKDFPHGSGRGRMSGWV